MPTPPSKDLGPEYLYAEDFLIDGEWKEYSLVVKAVHPPGTVEIHDGSKIKGPVVEFEKTNKKLVLCKTNQRLAHLAMGTAKVSQWVGKKLTLYAGKGKAFGHMTPWIRVRVAVGMIPYGVRKHLGEDLTGTRVDTQV